MPLGKRHRFTDAEIALVRREYPTASAASIAKRIFGTGRAAKAIFRLAFRLGLTKFPHYGPKTLASLRRLHGRGLTDTRIAAELGLERGTVSDNRRRLGLPVNQAAIVAARRQAVKTQFARLGVRNAGELRALAYRKYASENGWPDDLRFRAVQILNVLAHAGKPMTARQLAAAIGLPAKSQAKRIPLHSNDREGTYTAHLIARGLVVSLRQSAPSGRQGKGRKADLYFLGPAALEILNRRLQQETDHAGSAEAR